MRGLQDRKGNAGTARTARCNGGTGSRKCGSKGPKRKGDPTMPPYLQILKPKLVTPKKPAKERGILTVSPEAVDFWIGYFNLHAMVPLRITGAFYLHKDGEGTHHVGTGCEQIDNAPSTPNP